MQFDEGRSMQGDQGQGGGGLKQMKQQLKQMERGITNIARSIARIKKAGGSVPSEYEATIAELQAAIATVKNATEESDEVDAAMEVLMDKSSDLHELGPKLGMLEQFPRILKEATKQLAQARKQLTKAVTRAKKAGVDVSAIQSSIESKLTAIESDIAAAKSAADPEEGMESLRDNAFEAMEDIRDEMMVLENISNSSRMVKEAEKEIARIERASATLKRQKKDTTVLNELIAEMKAQLAEIKSLMQQSGIDKEDLFEALSEGERIRNDAQEELARLRGEKTEIDRQFNAPDVSRSNLEALAVYAFADLLEGLGIF